MASSHETYHPYFNQTLSYPQKKSETSEARLTKLQKKSEPFNGSDFFYLMITSGFLMKWIFICLKAGLTDAIDTHFYVFDKARKGVLHGFGVHMKALRF